MSSSGKCASRLGEDPNTDKLIDQLAPGRVFISQRGTHYICVAGPDFEYRNVEAVRLAHPIRMRRRQIRTHRVAFHRVRESSVLLDTIPGLDEREKWEGLIARAADGEFSPVEPEGPVSASSRV